MGEHREARWDPAQGRIVAKVAPAASLPLPWKPARVVFIVSNYASRCYWCGRPVASRSNAAFYPDERETAHTECHREACP